MYTAEADSCHVCVKDALAAATVYQTKLAHLVKARHSWDFEMPDKHRVQPTGQTEALQPAR